MMKIAGSIITVMSLTIRKALRLHSSECIAFVGAGGKTTAMFQLARQLPGPVIVTATSHLGAWQSALADRHIITDSAAPLEEIEHALRGVILVTGPVHEERTQPINDDLLLWLREFCGYHSIPLLLEADGSRQRPLKGWAEHEPAIPPFVNLVVHCVGLSGLGRPLSTEHVHRPGIFAKLSGLSMGEIVTPAALVEVLTHMEGGLKNIPETARRVMLLNQADSPDLQALAHGLTNQLLAGYHSVLISSIEQQEIHAAYEPIAGIILAAGASRRFGKPKQLLNWRGEPFVRAVARKALEAGLEPVIVVTGASAEGVDAALNGLNVQSVRNPAWESGQASSIRAGVMALQDSMESMAGTSRDFQLSRVRAGGAIFLLTDQPQIGPAVLRALMEKHAQGLFAVVAPMVMDQRANPVLFDRDTFADLTALEGDVGGRAILHKHSVEYLPWHDDSLLLDVDTPEHYQRLVSDESL